MRARALALQQQQAEAAVAAAARQRPQQAAAVLAPPRLHEEACDVLAERLEDVMRQPPSPAAGSHAAQQNSRLVQLLATATAAVQLSTRAVEACAAAGRPLPPCWAPAGALAAKLQLALQACGNQLAEACKRLEGFHAAEEQGLRQLVAALHDYQRTSGSSELADSILRWGARGVGAQAGALQGRWRVVAALRPGTRRRPLQTTPDCLGDCVPPPLLPLPSTLSSCRCMPQVQDLFLHAAAVVPEVVATQAAVATRGLAAATGAAAEWLDDDLDVGGRAPAVARWVLFW